MTKIYLDFIRNNQAEELQNWAKNNESKINNINHIKAWNLLSSNILAGRGTSKTKIIIKELMRWNNVPSCLIISDRDKNFIRELVYRAVNASSKKLRAYFLGFAKEILSYVDVSKIPDAILFDIAGFCIISQRCTNNEKIIDLRNMLLFLLKIYPVLTENRSWDNPHIIIYEAQRYDVINLISLILVANNKATRPMLHAVFSDMLENNKLNETDIQHLPFGVRFAMITTQDEELIGVKYFKLNKKSVDKDFFVSYGNKFLNKKPYVIVQQFSGLDNKLCFYFCYPLINDFDFLLVEMEDFPRYKDGVKKSQSDAVSDAAWQVFQRANFFSLPQEFLKNHFNNLMYYDHDKGYSIINDFLNKDNNRHANYINNINENKNKMLSMEKKVFWNDHLSKDCILEKFNQFLLELTNDFDSIRTPVCFIGKKLQKITMDILVNIFSNPDFLLLLEQRTNHLELIEATFDYLEYFRKSLADKHDVSFNIPLILYQIKINFIFSKYSQAVKELQDLDESKINENIVRAKSIQSSDYFIDLINVLAIYIETKITEKNKDNSNSYALLIADELKNIPLTNILNDFNSQQFFNLSAEEINKFIDITQYLNESDFNTYQDIIEKATIFKKLHFLLESNEKEDFYLLLLENVEKLSDLQTCFRQMYITMKTMTKFFKAENQISNPILLKKENQVELQDSVESYMCKFLSPLILNINTLSEKIIPTVNSKNFFTIIINDIIENTLSLIHQYYVYVMTERQLIINNNLDKNIKIFLKPIIDIIPLFSDSQKVNRFIADELKEQLTAELSFIESAYKTAEREIQAIQLQSIAVVEKENKGLQEFNVSNKSLPADQYNPVEKFAMWVLKKKRTRNNNFDLASDYSLNNNNRF